MSTNCVKAKIPKRPIGAVGVGDGRVGGGVVGVAMRCRFPLFFTMVLWIWMRVKGVSVFVALIHNGCNIIYTYTNNAN